MNEYSEMTFTITNIAQEKRPDGNTVISFVPNDGNVYEHEITITTKTPIEKIGKTLLRDSMLAWYSKHKKSGVAECVKIGDVI